MVQSELEVGTREPADRVRILDLRGTITRSSQGPLTAGYHEASGGGVETVILNFSEVEAVDSYGIGQLIALLGRAQYQKQNLLACGLSAQLQQAFQVTYLDEALEVYAGETEALQSLRS
jgi:anti-anti-sigma factor